MRTTVNIDDDVLCLARSQAQRERLTIGKVISRMVRDGIRAQPAPPPKPATPRSKFTLLPARDEIITSKQVRYLMDKQGI